MPKQPFPPADKQPANDGTDNVVDLFEFRKEKAEDENPIIRLAPELDGLEMLYSNDVNKEKLFSMKILCWALYKDGTIDAMVPWLSRLVPAVDLQDPLNGHWEGYYDNRTQRLFYKAPAHKVAELEGAASYFHSGELHRTPDTVMQEIPDNIGTHAVMTSNGFQSVSLTQVTSWQLMGNGKIRAMIADYEKVEATPVLPGDRCLYPVHNHDDFKYFFHHLIANKIKAGDPEAMAAFSQLIDR